MPRYTIAISETVEHTYLRVVEAETEDAANELAQADLDNGLDEATMGTWSYSTNSSSWDVRPELTEELPETENP